MIVPVSDSGPLASLEQAFFDYEADPKDSSSQQDAAVHAIDSVIDALNFTHGAIESVLTYFHNDGIPDIYLDSHLYQTRDLLFVAAAYPLPYALRQAWNRHLAQAYPLGSVTPLVRQSISALAQASWFLDSAQSYFSEHSCPLSLHQDLLFLQSALHPSPPLTLL